MAWSSYSFVPLVLYESRFLKRSLGTMPDRSMLTSMAFVIWRRSASAGGSVSRHASCPLELLQLRCHRREMRDSGQAQSRCQVAAAREEAKARE